VATIEVADVPFLRRKNKEPRVKPQDASLAQADTRLNALRQRVEALKNVKTVVTIRTRQPKSQ